MSYDNIYWLIMGGAFVLTGIVGVVAMRKTGKLLYSFLVGTLVNLAIILIACFWWASIFQGQEHDFSRQFGLFGFGIDFINNEVLLLFAQFVMRRNTGEPPTPVEE